MSTTVVETGSNVGDSELENATRRMHPEDWVLPEVQMTESSSGVLGPSTSSSKAEDGLTIHHSMASFSPPVRRKDLSVRLPENRITMLQQWECIVTSIDEDCVACELHDLTDQSQGVEYAEVYINEFSHFDRALLHEGAVFYWSIGFETRKTGQVKKYSELRVRRMPPLSASQKRGINIRAGQLSGLFKHQS